MSESLASIKTMNIAAPRLSEPSSATISRVVLEKASMYFPAPTTKGLFVFDTAEGDVTTTILDSLRLTEGVIGAGPETEGLITYVGNATSLVVTYEGEADWADFLGSVMPVEDVFIFPNVPRMQTYAVDVYSTEATPKAAFPSVVIDASCACTPLTISNKPFGASGVFRTAPLTATVNAFDKKYSEVFKQVELLRNPDPEDDGLCATEFAYWNCLKTVAGAYEMLKAKQPRFAGLPTPTILVEDSGGIRLIWRAPAKVVRANFGARSDLKSYLYYESGQVYDIESLDPKTLASRLEWLL